MVITMQKEVAERIVALPGKKTFGSLTVKVQFFSTPRLEFLIGRENFVPPPKVDSAVVSFVPVEGRQLPGKGYWKDFFDFIDVICRHRRKSLRAILHKSGLCGESTANIQQLLERLRIEPNLRPESLSLDTYIALYDGIRQQCLDSQQGR
jgi:16S rRNA (adenine1518-N6/adenine1519-N6)-dimethyltransferase